MGTPLRLALDTTHLYFTDTEEGVVARVPKAGGPAEELATGQERPVAIAVDDTSVYWVNIDSDVLMRVDKPD